MPALWQSSQRPMYVRTVWVGGFRHAILTPDDPFYVKNARNRRPHSSATCTSSKLSRKRSSRLSETESLEDCLRKFNFVIKQEQLVKQRPKRSNEVGIEKLDLSDVDQESEEDFILRANPQPLCNFDSNRSRFDNVYLSMRTLKSNRTNRNEVKENTELSDRVLQWLDLAGKVDLLAPDNVERMTQPRHSWPEIQRRNNLVKARTAVDLRTKESKTSSPKGTDSAKAQRSGAIDRHDFYIPASANTIENYARQSRNQNTPRNDNAKTKDNKTKNKDIRTNILEARQKMVSERNEMERKYSELISKKLIPDLKGNKKQVHIFMPELPKRMGSIASNTTSRAESLLSQFSQLPPKSNK